MGTPLQPLILILLKYTLTPKANDVYPKKELHARWSPKTKQTK